MLLQKISPGRLRHLLSLSSIAASAEFSSNSDGGSGLGTDTK